MSDVIICPAKLSGEIIPPPSKSIAHRAIICAAVSQGDCLINNVVLSDDIDATINGMRAMGSKCELVDTKLFITRCVRREEADINCRESGSTMRFLIPLAAALGINTRFSGEGRLPLRTVSLYENLLSEKGVQVKSLGGFLPMEIKGNMSGGVFRLSGDISSQFISGLLMAIPMTGDGGRVELTSTLQSAPYVDITIDVMKHFRVNVLKGEGYFEINKQERYISNDYTIEPDYSQAAFWLVANELGSAIDIKNLSTNSVQGDKAIIDIINSLRGDKDITIDAKNIPDLVPIITVLCGLREGRRTTIVGAERLMLKESDRLESTSAMLNVLGADFNRLDDGFIINGVKEYKGGTIDSYNDHRIAMAAAIASTRCKEQLKILNADCVKKSYVNFFQEFFRLQGRV